jgi:hypothetical protein
MPKSTPGVDDLVEALMVAAGHINLMLVHMSRATSHEDADPPLIVLRGLLRGTLAPLADKFSYDDIVKATRIVNRSTATLEREILLVPPAFFEEEEDE